MGEPLGWAWKKAACGEGGKGGPSGAQAAVCLAWRLYASFGADIVHGALAFAPTLGGTGAGSICVRDRPGSIAPNLQALIHALPIQF